MEEIIIIKLFFDYIMKLIFEIFTIGNYFIFFYEKKIIYI